MNLTDESGGVRVSYILDPWGHIREQVGESVNRQIFTGQEHDERTGLIYIDARYYDPDIARFTTQDAYLGELGTPPSLHRYLYAYGNPLVYVDPNGNMSIRQWFGIDEESSYETLAWDNSLGTVLGLTVRQSFYDVWSGLTGGFLSRQDVRQEKYDSGEISSSEYWLGTGIDTGVSMGSQLVGGAAGGKVTGIAGSGLAGTAAAGDVRETRHGRVATLWIDAEVLCKLGQRAADICVWWFPDADNLKISGRPSHWVLEQIHGQKGGMDRVLGSGSLAPIPPSGGLEIHPFHTDGGER